MSIYSFRGVRSTQRLLIEFLALAVVVCVSAIILTTSTEAIPEPGSCQAAEPIKLTAPAMKRSLEAPREKAIRTYAESYGLSVEDVRRAVYRLEYEISD